MEKKVKECKFEKKKKEKYMIVGEDGEEMIYEGEEEGEEMAYEGEEIQLKEKREKLMSNRGMNLKISCPLPSTRLVFKFYQVAAN